MNRPRKDLTWRERLTLVLVGLFIAAYGHAQNLRGKPIYTNWQGLDVPADFVIFLGGVCLLASILPWGRIGLTLDSHSRKHRRR